MSAGPLVVAVLGRGIVDPAEPVIHADDLGLLRGLAVFETIRIYGGRPFALDAHLDRLQRSADRLGLAVPERAAIVELATDAIAAAGIGDGSVRYTLTGGREATSDPVLMVTIAALPSDLETIRADGITVISLQLGIDPRMRTDSPWLLGGVKSTSYAVNMAAWAEARRRGADDAIFLAADGSVMEGPVTNIWWRLERTLYTPALDLGILAGVTRATLLDLARDVGYEVREGWFPVTDMAAAEEAFTSSSVRELMPIVGLDGEPIGDGRPGATAVELQTALRRLATA
jgi:4-amino-4-deoxychorismate lyase